MKSFSLLVCIAVLVLSACSMGASKPVYRQPTLTPQVKLAPQNVMVWVALPDGTTVPMAQLLADSAAQALADEGVPAKAVKSTRPVWGNNLRYVLLGRVAENTQDPNIRHARVMHWTLEDRQGAQPQVVAHQALGVAASRQQWEFGDPRVISQVGRNIAKVLVKELRQLEKNKMPKDPTRDGIWVRAVRGAPGDGNEGLSRAIRRALLAEDIPVTGDSRQASFALDGVVALSEPAFGRQNIRITWVVSRIDGEEMGRAVQENTIQQGALDGPWGTLTSRIAQAAVPGVRRIFDPLASGGSADSPFPPLGEDLPRLPGRALPPPP